MRRISWASVAQYAGAVTVVAGVGWLFGYAVGLIVAGVAALAFGIAGER